MDKVEQAKNTITERWEQKVDLVAKGLMSERKRLLKAVGQRPYRGEKATPDEQRADYEAARRDPEAWQNLLKNAVRFKPDGRVLVRRDFMEAVRQQENSLRLGEAKAKLAKMVEEVGNANV